jgi:hypothetical protein
MYIWLGSQLDPTFVQSVFGLQTASQIQPEKVGNLIEIFFYLEILFIVSVVLLTLIIRYQRMSEHY